MSKKVIWSLVFLGGLASVGFADSGGDWSKQVNAAEKAQRQGDLSSAENLLLRGLLTAEGFGSADPRGAYTLDYLGTLYTQSGRSSDAIAVFERALKGFDLALGPHSEDALSSAGRLADAYETAGRWAKAANLRRRLLAEVTGQADPDKAALAQAESDLGLCLDAQKKWDEAMALYSDALEKRTEALGPDAPEVAETLSNEGRIFLLRGDPAEAGKLMRRALAIDQKTLGPADAAVADDLRRLAVVLKKSGHVHEAVLDEKQAESIDSALRAGAPEPTPRLLPRPGPQPAGAASSPQAQP